ncbi:MAG TPA: uroporphyrinogen decarboxylase family protein [Capsulimonadaceae bacterium]|jgi:hypothetical protein
MLQGFDYLAHNQEVMAVWDSYNKRNPIRVPIIWGMNTRYTMLNEIANPRKITYEQYFDDPAIMLERLLEHQEFIRMNVRQDAEMGLPSDGWHVWVDFQNTAEAAWFGCKVKYCADQVPDTEPLLTDSNKYMLLDAGIPDPFAGGIMAKNWEFYNYMLRAKHNGFTWRGRPLISVTPEGLTTDGPLTIACNLRGTTSFFMDLLDDTDYAMALLGYVTEATIARIKAFRAQLGMPAKAENFFFADDSIQLISNETYRKVVYPFHKRLVDEFASGGDNRVHLCGDASRHFVYMRDTLGIKSFDTGFPINLGIVRQQLGPDVEILGGPSVPFLKWATPTEVRAEVRRILTSGVMDGKRFILREANNLAPDIPLANLAAMYDAGREFGRY